MCDPWLVSYVCLFCARRQVSDSNTSLQNIYIHSQSPVRVEFTHNGAQRIYNIITLPYTTNSLAIGQRVPLCEPNCRHDECDMRNFFMLANAKYIVGSDHEIEVCPLCVCKVRKIVKSHIFPKCLLLTYDKIHDRKGYDKVTDNFILDSSNGLTNAANLKYPLLCEGCEKGNSSAEEQYLNNSYIRIMASNGPLRIELKESHKLRHILGTILFRSALLKIKFLEESRQPYFEAFFNRFLELRKYCCTKKVEVYKELPIAEKIHVYLLYNTSFSRPAPSVVNSKPIIEFALHNPRFTSLVCDKSGDVFMYCKFDCFHVELPIIELPIIEHETPACNCFSDCYKVKDGQRVYFNLPQPRQAVDSFPERLLQYNLSMIWDYLVDELVRVTPITCVLETFAMKKYAKEEYDGSADLTTNEDTKTESNLVATDLSPEKRDKLIEVAKKRSSMIMNSYRLCPGELETKAHKLSQKSEADLIELKKSKEKCDALGKKVLELEEQIRNFPTATSFHLPAPVEECNLVIPLQ